MREAANTGARLLVVDDNKVNRLLLSRNLELQGHSVACAENGRVALEMLRRDRFDLLLLDMEMPEMDGFQVLERAARRICSCATCRSSSRRRWKASTTSCAASSWAPRTTCRSRSIRCCSRRASARASRRSGCATSRRSCCAASPRRKSPQDLQQSGFALGGRRVHATVMFSDIRRLHAARGIAAARGDDRPPQHLLRADVRCDQRPRRRRHADDGRRADGRLRRAADASRTTARARCARRSK